MKIVSVEKKKIVDKSVDKCTANVEEVKLAKKTSAEDENKHNNKCSCCTLYIVLLSIISTISVEIGTYFVYYKYMNHDKKTDAEEKFYFSNSDY